MNDLHTVRRTNLRHLIDSYGGPTSLSEKLGYSNGSFLVQIAGPNPIRPLTEKTARKIEEKLKLEEGWFDREHTGIINYAKSTASIVALDTERLVDCIAAVSHAAEDLHLHLNPEKIGALVALIYDYTGQDLAAHAVRLVKLTA
jgi:hypothetical protein